jgi:hypothetical protein
MALHENSSARYVHLTCGKFKSKVDGEYKEFGAVDGFITKIGFGSREFQGRVQQLFIIEMSEGQDNYRIDMANKSVGSVMFSQNLKGIKHGDLVKISAFPNKDNEKVSCVVCDVWDGNAWVRAERHDWSGESWPDKQDKSQETIKAHALFNAVVSEGPTDAPFDPFVEE